MFTNLEQVEQFFQERKNFGIKPGLDRMEQLLKSQNNPHERIKTIHIAGTNGKGSTQAYIKEALIQHNYKVGVFTSPSLSGITGHMLINDLPIPIDLFLTHLNNLLPTIEQLDVEEMHPTEFEIITTIAFMYFVDAVDIAIIECGMGGREDATNCIHPILSIITNIAMDHASFLGNTLQEIAYQKAGIIKENTPTILGDIDDSCLAVFLQEGTLKNSTIYQYRNEYHARDSVFQQNSQAFQWKYNQISLPITIGMKGQHQIENASTALMALQLLMVAGYSIEWPKVQTAFQTATLSGRFEKLIDNPIVIVDGAHNPDGMEAFLRTVQSEYGQKEKTLIFAGFRDKELNKMMKSATPYFQTVILTTFESPRAANVEELEKQFHGNNMMVNPDWKEIVHQYVLQDKERKRAYFFAGSLHFIGLVRQYLLDAIGGKLS
jgi:dihydrofolate synthase / folylpolyglutamate synthase